MIYSNNIFEMLSRMIAKQKVKGKIKSNSHFPKKNSLYDKWVIWVKLFQIYATLYLMINSIDICKMLRSIMGYNT